MGYSYWTGGVAAKDGVWGPVTSTLDWCEENYVLTPYVAELWNSTSNVFFLLLAWLAVINLQAVGANEVRNYIAIWSLIVVAVGSILFHGTLWYSYQMLDELPMIYNACILVFCALQIYPESRDRKLTVGLALSAYSAAVTSIYLAIKNPEFLALSHGTLAVYLIYLLTAQIQHMSKTHLQHASKIHSLWTLHKWALVSYFCGFVVWSIDNNFCSALRQAREVVGTPLGFVFEFHVWWHLFAACGGYGVILLVAYMRLLAVGRGEVDLVWVRGVLPLMRLSKMAPVRFKVDGSYLSFTEAPIVGRKSFKSFNAEIEALAETQESEQRSLRSTLIEGRESISEAEMVSRFKKLKNQPETTTATSGKKSTGKKRKQEKNETEADVEEDGALAGSEHGAAQRFKFIKPAVE
ncbi:Alkaline ceramidase 3 [Chytriomyces hyalinus]|nr:Alkaline ceramidase 3 [Chytriomyces hyalinus]